MNLWHELISGSSAPSPVTEAGAPKARWLLPGLLLLAIVPRALVAWRLVGVCDDSFYYLWLADAWDRGNFVGLDFLNINIFPVILLGLHRLGLDWIVAGKLWGVVVSSAAVLPLYGLSWRLFNRPVAIATALIYAVHPDLIELGVEPIREPTYWFLFLAALYATWRGVRKPSVAWMAVGGVSMALAVHTRVEGWLVLVPLLVWSARSAWLQPAAWRRLSIGIVLWAAATPAFVVAFNLTVLRHHDRWEYGRMYEIVLVKNVALRQFQRLTGQATPAADVASPPRRRTPVVIAEEGAVAARLAPHDAASICVRQLLRSIEVPCLACLAIGCWLLGRRMLFGDQLPLTVISAFLTAAIVARLIFVSDINGRYFLTAFLCVLPVAGIGLQWTLRQSVRLPGWGGALAPKLAPAALIAATALVGSGAALSSGHVRREAETDLGRRLLTRLHGPARVVTDHASSRLGYLLHGDLPRIVFGANSRRIEQEIFREVPDVLIVTRRKRKPSYFEPIVAMAARHGLSPAKLADVPEARSDFIILTRRPREVTAGKPPAGRLSGLPFPENAGRRL